MPAPVPPIISTTTPLLAGGTFTSSVQSTGRATQITGSVFADQSGTLTVKQGGDGTNWDIVNTVNVAANDGTPIEIDLINPYFQIVYTNGGTQQTTFRLFINLRDVYGDFLNAALGPSAGGAYAVLFLSPSGYQYVGRFDGSDGQNACQNAAISQNQSGQYAAFLVANATVTIQTLITQTDFAAGTF